MSEQQGLAKTTKKVVITAVCVLVLLAAFGGGIVLGRKAVSRKAPIEKETPTQEVPAPGKQENMEFPEKQKENASIGLDAAKDTALEHAGFSAGDVTFIKAEFDNDDGEAVYEIEFYKDGREYEVTVNAKTGAVMEYDVD